MDTRNLRERPKVSYKVPDLRKVSKTATLKPKPLTSNQPIKVTSRVVKTNSNPTLATVKTNRPSLTAAMSFPAANSNSTIKTRISSTNTTSETKRLSSVSSASSIPKRLSTGTVKLSVPSTKQQSLAELVNQLEVKLARLEEKYNQLKEDNDSLRVAVAFLSDLETKIVETKKRCSVLKIENENLRSRIAELNVEIAGLKEANSEVIKLNNQQ